MGIDSYTIKINVVMLGTLLGQLLSDHLNSDQDASGLTEDKLRWLGGYGGLCLAHMHDLSNVNDDNEIN